MLRKTLFISVVVLFMCSFCFAKQTAKSGVESNYAAALSRDTVPQAEVMQVVNAAINSLNSFNIDAVANLYTQNAVVADDEPPYSWNGPTAGVQWVNAVEQVCKENRLTKLKGSIGTVSVYQQSTDNVYVVVPVIYTGLLPGKAAFEANGAFAFVLRNINGKWLIKSQVWVPRRAL